MEGVRTGLASETGTVRSRLSEVEVQFAVMHHQQSGWGQAIAALEGQLAEAIPSAPGSMSSLPP